MVMLDARILRRLRISLTSQQRQEPGSSGYIKDPGMQSCLGDMDARQVAQLL